MRKWAKGAAGATLLTASFVALGAGPALADVTNGNGSVLGGNQVNAPISIPVDVSGNSLAVLGPALAGSQGGSSVHGVGGHGGVGRTSGRHSIGGGNQINAPISVPANACGNAVAVVGGARAGCKGGTSVRGGHGYAGGGASTSGAHSILGGNQVHAPVTAPVNVCGNAAAVLGAALAGCKGGASVHGVGGGGFHGRTAGYGSIGGGNQLHAPVNAPINACGNAIGNALAGCKGGAAVYGGRGYGGHGYAGGGASTSGAHSILGGNQVHAPDNAPIDVCGNAAAVLGHAGAGCAGSLGAGGYHPGGHHGRTSGRGCIGGGNQVHAPVTAPVDDSGNAVAVVGRALGSCGADHGGPGAPGYPGGDDCITPSSYRTNSLPQLPVGPKSLGTGALPVSMGAPPALPQLDGLGRNRDGRAPAPPPQDTNKKHKKHKSLLPFVMRVRFACPGAMARGRQS